MRKVLALAVLATLAGGVVALASVPDTFGTDGPLADRHGRSLGGRVAAQLASSGIRSGRTTLDRVLQRAAEDALDEGIRRARAGGRLAPVPAGAGSAVVVDVRDGSVLALASDDEAVTVRATESAPPGSVVKPFAAIGAMRAGITTPAEPIDCPAEFRYGGGVFRNWRPEDVGPLTVSGALADSCNSVFYTLAARSWESPPGSPAAGAIERAFTAFGFGRPTGAVPTEHIGTVARPASAGESIAGAVGQGRMRATPLQIARAYAAVARGGSAALRDLRGREGPAVDPPMPRTARAAVLEGLRRVPADGTAANAFLGSALSDAGIAGKTGTAEVNGSHPHSWFVAFGPSFAPRYLVVVSVEGGGQGARTAAPIARDILEDVFRLFPEALRRPAPATPALRILGFVALAIAAGAVTPIAGAFVGAVAGAMVDTWIGPVVGPWFVSLAVAGWTAGRLRRRIPLPAAIPLAASCALLLAAVLARAHGVEPMPWRDHGTQVATTAALAAGAGLLLEARRLPRLLVRRRR